MLAIALGIDRFVKSDLPPHQGRPGHVCRKPTGNVRMGLSDGGRVWQIRSNLVEVVGPRAENIRDGLADHGLLRRQGSSCAAGDRGHACGNGDKADCAADSQSRILLTGLLARL